MMRLDFGGGFWRNFYNATQPLGIHRGRNSHSFISKGLVMMHLEAGFGRNFFNATSGIHSGRNSHSFIFLKVSYDAFGGGFGAEFL